MYLFAVLGFLSIIVIYYYYSTRPIPTPSGLKSVPVVDNKIPILGHIIAFSKNNIGFIQYCYRTFGKIFRIKLAKKNIIVICDRSMIKEYFRATEDKMSLYDILEDIFFRRAFFKDSTDFKRAIQIIKSSIAIRFDVFIPKIKEEATKLVQNMKQNNGQKVNLSKEMIKFVANTGYRCFVSNEINEDFMEYLFKFTSLLNRTIVLTYFLPHWLLNLTCGLVLTHYRNRMVELVDSEIESYRKFTNKNDSMIIRKAIDFIDNDDNKLCNRQVVEIIICLLYVSSENTALGLVATLVEISKNNYWNSIKNICEKYLITDNIPDLMDDSMLNASIHEASRLNTHIFSIQRKPKNISSAICGYHVGGADVIAVCEPMLMSLDCSSDVFSLPSKFNPERFIKINTDEEEIGLANTEPKIEPMTANYVMTWGGLSHHFCPGKSFALLEIKMAVALILSNFDQFKITDEQYDRRDYFSPSAYAERNIELNLSSVKN